MKRCLLVLALVASLTSGCAKAPPNLSPNATIAFNATRVVTSLDLLRDFAIRGYDVSPSVLPEVTVRKIVMFHQSALHTIQAAPSGWVHLIQVGLDELLKDLPPADRARVEPYVSLTRTLISELYK